MEKYLCFGESLMDANAALPMDDHYKVDFPAQTVPRLDYR